MSSRTVPRFALAASLAAVFTAPTFAQEKLPEAPMPRAKSANRIEVVLQWTFNGPTLAPAPRPAGDVSRPVCPDCVRADGAALVPPVPAPSPCETCPIRAPRESAFVIGVGGLRRVMPMPEPPLFLVPPTPIPTGSFVIHEDGRVTPATAAAKVVRATACETCATSAGANPLHGTWYRDAGMVFAAVTFAGDEMTIKLTQREGEIAVTTTITAHCTATKDGLVYGAITGADVDVSAAGKGATGMELAELSLMCQELTDMPFSFRTKATTAGLMVSHLKLTAEASKKELMILGGLYKYAKDGKVPEPKPLSGKTGGRCEERRPLAGAAIGAAIGLPIGAATGAMIGVAEDKDEPFQRIGVDFNTLPVMGQPVVPVGIVLPPATFPTPPGFAPQPVRPVSAVPTDAMKQMASEAFGQILQETGVTGRGMTLPSPRYLEHYPQYFAPDPVLPLPRELAAQDLPRPTAPKAAHVGTWVREVGSKRCVVKVAHDHFTATVSEAHDIGGGKTVTGHLTFTVDYHVARDGVTAVGLLTGVDVKFDGDLPDGDTEVMMQKTGELQKMLEDKPVALTLRVYADALVIGNVRMQTVGGLMESEPAAYLGGRYRAMTDKALSPLKAVKRPEPSAGVPPATYTPPGGFAPQPHNSGAYGSPVGDLLPPQYLPAPRSTPSATLPPIPTVEANPLTRVAPASGVTIPEPLPTMPTPAAPTRVMPQPAKPGPIKQKSANDEPSHLTPERIHGGIY